MILTAIVFEVPGEIQEATGIEPVKMVILTQTGDQEQRRAVRLLIQHSSVNLTEGLAKLI